MREIPNIREESDEDEEDDDVVERESDTDYQGKEREY